MNLLEKLVYSVKNVYYGPLIIVIAELATIVIGLTFGRKDKFVRLFVAYAAFDFLMIAISHSLDVSYSGTARRNRAGQFANVLVAYVELLVYFTFFNRLLKSKTVIKFLNVSSIVFTSIVLVFIFTGFEFLTPRYGYVSYLIGTTEFMLMLVPCLRYFYELLNGDTTVDLFSRPSFWVTTGIFTYAVASIPYFLISRFMLETHTNFKLLFALLFFYIPFAMNFLFLIRAFLLKRPLTE